MNRSSMAGQELRRFCSLCQANIDRDRWQVDPPDVIGKGPCALCRSEGPLVQEVWMTLVELEELRANYPSPSKPTVSDFFARKAREADAEWNSHIRPEIRALIERGNVTVEEVAKLRCNSWEWQSLTPVLDDEAFVARL